MAAGNRLEDLQAARAASETADPRPDGLQQSRPWLPAALVREQGIDADQATFARIFKVDLLPLPSTSLSTPLEGPARVPVRSEMLHVGV